MSEQHLNTAILNIELLKHLDNLEQKSKTTVVLW